MQSHYVACGLNVCTGQIKVSEFYYYQVVVDTNSYMYVWFDLVPN